MPIKPENRHHYRTPEWKAARLAVLKRAGEVRDNEIVYREACCEFCWAENRSTVSRVAIDGILWQRKPGAIRWSDCDCPSANARLALGDAVVRSVKIILTVAHLDHDPTNNSLDNLRALCQRCHNRHDREHRAANRAKTRAAKASNPKTFTPATPGSGSRASHVPPISHAPLIEAPIVAGVKKGTVE